MDTEASNADQQTVVALFEDIIDAERALVELRKGEPTADQVSLLLHDQFAEDDQSEDRTGAVARAIVANKLDAIGDWLQGLSSLIIPQRGTFLAGGPIGAVLAGISTGELETDELAESGASGVDPRSGSLLHTLSDFGFTPAEASYIDHRMEAGSILVGVTCDNEAPMQAIRRIFADHAAVYIGMAWTEAALYDEASAMLMTPPERTSGNAVTVTDTVAPIRRASETDGSPEATALFKRDVVDARGRDSGTVNDVLIEIWDPDGPRGPAPEQQIPRYLVIGFGGLLGLGRHYVAVPMELVVIDNGPIRLRIDQNVLKHTPAFDEDAPFSRHEELALLAFFGLRPYWLDPAPPPRAPDPGPDHEDEATDAYAPGR